MEAAGPQAPGPRTLSLTGPWAVQVSDSGCNPREGSFWVALGQGIPSEPVCSPVRSGWEVHRCQQVSMETAWKALAQCPAHSKC